MTTPRANPDPNVGRLLKGERYRLVRRLDSGGMGDVYLARDQDLDRDVAVKLIRATEDSIEQRARFRREIQALVSLSHPNIVALLDGPRADDPDRYYVMELLDGISLQAALAATPQLAVDQVIRVVGAIGEALDVVHGTGRMHRDVKPGNIFLCESGVIKLLDFGLARAPADTAVTAEAQPGTQLYMSPECLEGGHATDRSDQYALGVVAFEVLTGSSPFPGSNFNWIARFSADFASVGSLRRDLPNAAAVDDVMRKVLAVDLAARFDSCTAFARALTRALTGVATVGRAAAPTPTDQPVADAATGPPTLGRPPDGSRAHPWPRYWARRGATVFADSDGFLMNPDAGSFRVSMNPQAVPLSDLRSAPVLILLGEPGMGKSVELARECARARVGATTHEVVHEMDLRDVVTAEELRRRFASAPFTRLAADPSQKLVLFLDSLDEGMLEVRQLAALLVAELRKLDPRRTSLRIACRTADWPALLEEGLVASFGKDQVQAHELLWLRQQDAFDAATDEGIADPAAFLRSARLGGITALALRPLTLRFLIGVYKKDGQLPATRSALYLEGCLQLVTEQSTARLAARQIGLLRPSQRLVVAGRLAALSVLSNRPVFEAGAAASSLTTDNLVVRDAVGGHERDAVDTFSVADAQVNEVLGTGLFTATTETTRLTWAHRSYAEFLAAWYLSSERIALAELLPLITITNSGGPTIVPGLAETIGWLGTLRADVRTWVMLHQPDVLLQGDPSQLSSDEKRALVDAMLARASDVELDDYIVRQRQFAGLDYPALADQLRPLLDDRAAPPARRLRAIEIARAAKVSTLAERLASIALDESEADAHRIDAAYAVRTLGDDATKQRLLPLARHGTEGDTSSESETNIELKGCALEALSPALLSTTAVFALLVPSMAGHATTYDYFLDHFADRLTAADLPAGLAWLADQDEEQHQLEGFGTRALQTRLLELAFAGLANPSVRSALAEVLARRASQHGSFIADASTEAAHVQLTADPESRRALIAEMLPRLRQPQDAFEIVHGHPLTLFDRQDLPWLLDCIERADPGSSEESRWLELMSWAFDASDATVIDRLCTLCLRRPSVDRRFGKWFAAVDLDSAAAEQGRAALAQQEEHERRRQEVQTAIGPARDRWLPLLDAAEHGDLDAWWRLNVEFLREGPRGRHIADFSRDLAARPLWQSASGAERRRMLAAALRFVQDRDAGEAEWPEQQPGRWRPAVAGYRALVLLASQDAAAFAQLDATVWERWASTVGGLLSTSTRDDAYARMLTLCLSHARNSTEAALIRVLRTEITTHGDLFSLAALRDVQDPAIGDLLFTVLQQHAQTYAATLTLLRDLLARGHAAARAWAEACAQTGQSGEERTSAAAMALIEVDAPTYLHAIWSRAERTPPLAETLLRHMSVASLFVSRFEGEQGSRSASERAPPLTELVPIVTCAVRTQPRTADPVRPQMVAYSVTERDEFARWRDALLSMLARSGAPEAFAALEALCGEFPTDMELRYLMEQGRRTFRQSSWRPVPASTLLRLVARRGTSSLLLPGRA